MNLRGFASGEVLLGALPLTILVIAYLALVGENTQLSPVNIVVFCLWLTLMVRPIGRMCATLLGVSHRFGTFEAFAVETLLGLISVAVVTMAVSLAGSPAAITWTLYCLGLVAWVLWARTRRGFEGRDQRWLVPAGLTIAACVLHMALLPPYYSGVSEDGLSLHLAGIGADNFYLPYAQQIAQTGALAENRFYAGQPMVYHHYLSMFMVAAYWLTVPGPADPFATRLLFHFVSGTPLLLALLVILCRRWTRSSVWTGVLLVAIVLPVTNYPQGAGWAGMESMNAFWVIGVHADLSYLYGLIAFLAALLLLDWFSERAPTLPEAAGLQCLLAAATQIKFNYAIAYAIAIECSLLIIAYRVGRLRLLARVAGTGFMALAIIQAMALSISQVHMNRSLGFDYGLMMRETMMAALRGNEAHSWIVAVLDWVQGPAQPILILVAYCLVYTPLFAVVLLHITTSALSWRRLGIVDSALLGIYAMALFIVLWWIESGAEGRYLWNVAGHLHYLIPIIAVLSTARVLSSRQAHRSIRLAAGGLALVLGVSTTVGVLTSTKQFSFWKTWTIENQDLIAILRDVERETLPTAALIPHGLAIADEYTSMLTNRSLLISPSFAYAEREVDAAARARVVARVTREWPDVPSISRQGLQGIGSDRPLYLVGRIPDGARASQHARCRGNYCFWLLQQDPEPPRSVLEGRPL